MGTNSTTARAIAAEDIRAGMYIAILHEIDFGCRMCWEEEPELMARRMPRLKLPWDADPHRVKAVSLPFILAQQPDGEQTTLDVRRYRLARLPSAFGRKAFEKLRRETAEAKKADEKSDAEVKA